MFNSFDLSGEDSRSYMLTVAVDFSLPHLSVASQVFACVHLVFLTLHRQKIWRVESFIMLVLLSSSPPFCCSEDLLLYTIKSKSGF